MRVHVILNIVSIFFLTILYICSELSITDNEKFRKFYDEQKEMGIESDAIFKNWNTRIWKIGKTIDFAMVLSAIIALILSIISLLLHRNFIAKVLIIFPTVYILFRIFAHIIGSAWRN